MDLETAAGVTFAVLAVVLSVFQIALAFGAPFGAAAYGGSNPGVLPRRLRITSAIAGFGIYPFFTLFVLDAAGIVDTGLADGSQTRTWLWILTGLLVLGSLMNFMSRSKIERIWGPVALILAGCSAVLAAGM